MLAVWPAGCSCGGPRTEIPAIDAPRFASPPTLDGDLSEWGAVPETDAFVSTMDGSRGDPPARGRFAWDDAYLYVAFEIDDPRVIAHGEGTDPHLWEEDCAELMFDPDGDERSYVELQASPTNAVFDTLYDTRRQPQPFGHVDYTSHLEPHARVRGTVNDDQDDEGYTIEMRIPWSAFAVGDGPAAGAARESGDDAVAATGSAGTPSVTGAPHVGETWRVAMYAIDVRGDDAWRGSGWSPPLEGDFHVPARFGRVTFRE